jgi:hypothetical protein
MYSVAFLKRLRRLQRQQVQASMPAVLPSAAEADSDETTMYSTGSALPTLAAQQSADVEVIVYDPSTGKAYPNPSAARAAGVNNFMYNAPSGINVDWSYWDQFAQPEPAPVEVAEIEVESQELPFEPTTYTPTPAPTPEPSPEPAAAPAAAAPPPPPPPPKRPSVSRSRSESKPKPQPVRIASREEWEKQGTYMHGAGHSGRNAGKSLRGDRNNDAYYANYVRVMNEANKSGNYSHAKEVNRAHSLPR